MRQNMSNNVARNTNSIDIGCNRPTIFSAYASKDSMSGMPMEDVRVLTYSGSLGTIANIVPFVNTSQYSVTVQNFAGPDAIAALSGQWTSADVSASMGRDFGAFAVSLDVNTFILAGGNADDGTTHIFTPFMGATLHLDFAGASLYVTPIGENTGYSIKYEYAILENAKIMAGYSSSEIRSKFANTDIYASEELYSVGGVYLLNPSLGVSLTGSFGESQFGATIDTAAIVDISTITLGVDLATVFGTFGAYVNNDLEGGETNFALGWRL